MPGDVAVSAPVNQLTSGPVRPRPVLKIDPSFGTKPRVDNRGRVAVALASIRAMDRGLPRAIYSALGCAQTGTYTRATLLDCRS